MERGITKARALGEQTMLNMHDAIIVEVEERDVRKLKARN
jgi:hypothetical protein